VGVFKTGNLVSDTMAYAALADVQRINLTPNKVNEIGVRLKDFSQAKEMADMWSQYTPEKIESWDEQNASFFNVFRIQDAVRYLTVVIIMIVAGFGIYNVLNMTVMQKRKDVAILRSLGYDNKDIIFLFYSQGLILGLVGAILGLISGYFFCLFLQTVQFGGGPMGGSGTLQVSMAPHIYVMAFIFAIIATSIASILPAHSAGKLTPIEIIRSGAE
jgi:lipoprotein-releasing system permease protein